MSGHRNKHAWIWVAIAAISLASVARGEGGLDSARAYANPVLQFLAKSHSASSVAKSGAARYAQRSSMGRIRAIFRDAGTGAWLSFLPVCFVGFIAPLRVFRGVATGYRGPTPAAPLLPFSFQRPPPQFV